MLVWHGLAIYILPQLTAVVIFLHHNGWSGAFVILPRSCCCSQLACVACLDRHWSDWGLESHQAVKIWNCLSETDERGVSTIIKRVQLASAGLRLRTRHLCTCSRPVLGCPRTFHPFPVGFSSRLHPTPISQHQSREMAKHNDMVTSPREAKGCERRWEPPPWGDGFWDGFEFSKSNRSWEESWNWKNMEKRQTCKGSLPGFSPDTTWLIEKESGSHCLTTGSALATARNKTNSSLMNWAWHLDDPPWDISAGWRQATAPDQPQLHCRYWPTHQLGIWTCENSWKFSDMFVWSLKCSQSLINIRLMIPWSIIPMLLQNQQIQGGTWCSTFGPQTIGLPFSRPFTGASASSLAPMTAKYLSQATKGGDENVWCQVDELKDVERMVKYSS